jgi:hypothetical protein
MTRPIGSVLSRCVAPSFLHDKPCGQHDLAGVQLRKGWGDPFFERQGDRARARRARVRFVSANDDDPTSVSHVRVDDVPQTADSAGFNTPRVSGSLDIGPPRGDDSIGLLDEVSLEDTPVRRVGRDWLEVVENGAGGAALYWILSSLEDHGTRPGDFDGFTPYGDSPAFQIMVNFALARGAGVPNDFPPVADHDAVYFGASIPARATSTPCEWNEGGAPGQTGVKKPLRPPSFRPKFFCDGSDGFGAPPR